MQFKDGWIICLILVLNITQLLAKEEIKKEEVKKNVATHPKIKAFNENAEERPTQCQVCRVVVTELMIELNKTANKKDTLWMSNRLDGETNEDKENKIDYHNSELRILETLETLCENTQYYKAIAGPDFPYLKGVKSMFQTELENMMGQSGLKLSLDAPQAIVDDPTLEIARLKGYCSTMLETHEDDILKWYFSHRQDDPIDYLCRKRILQGQNTECLTASTEVPDYATTPHPTKDSAKTNKAKTEL